jgi:hypothetical protein
MIQFAVGTRGFSFLQSIKQVLGPTQPPIQQIITALLTNVSSQDIMLTTHLHLVIRVIKNIHSLSHMLARHAQGQLYCTFCVTDQGVKAKMSTIIQTSY